MIPQEALSSWRAEQQCLMQQGVESGRPSFQTLTLPLPGG